MTHDLKIWPEFFQPVVTGVKTFEVRRDDRTYAQGDTLRLREFEPTQGYTGREVSRTVTYVLRDYSAGLRDGFVCLALGEPGPIGQCSFRSHAWDGNTVVKAKACKCGALTVMPTAEATALKVAPQPPTEQFMVDALAAAVADRDHSDAQLAAIEAAIREVCPAENSESEDDEEPEPRYICMDEDANRIIEADDMPNAIRQIVAAWDSTGVRCQAAEATLDALRSAPVAPAGEPPSDHTDACVENFDRLTIGRPAIEKACICEPAPVSPTEDFTAPLPPRPPAVVRPRRYDLVRYGVTWEGQDNQPLLTPMPDGYWTPWHLAVEAPNGERCVWHITTGPLGTWVQSRCANAPFPAPWGTDRAKACHLCGQPLTVEQ